MTPAHFPGFTAALDSVISIAVVVGFLVIFQSMYTAVMERTREIGILKSLGASRGYIVSTVLREAALVTVAGIVMGVVLTEIIKAGLGYRFPTRPFYIPAGLVAARGADRLCRRDSGGYVPGAEGCEQGPDRRSGLRISCARLVTLCWKKAA